MEKEEGRESVLSVENLKVSFQDHDKKINAVKGISFSIRSEEIFSIVGESGSGKSTTCLAILGLLSKRNGCHREGNIFFKGRNLCKTEEKEMRKIRGKGIALILQDSLSALNPFYRISHQMIALIRKQRHLSRKEAKAEAVRLLSSLGINEAEKRIDDYPFQFSGGMRQRVAIAMAIAQSPELIIADEITSSLDAGSANLILSILKEINEKTGTSILLITHDLKIAEKFSDRIAVMYSGHIVESAETEFLFRHPSHPYTRALIRISDNLRDERSGLFTTIEGETGLSDNPALCPFLPRCPERKEICLKCMPEGKWRDGGYVSCHVAQEKGDER